MLRIAISYRRKDSDAITGRQRRWLLTAARGPFPWDRDAHRRRCEIGRGDGHAGWLCRKQTREMPAHPVVPTTIMGSSRAVRGRFGPVEPGLHYKTVSVKAKRARADIILSGVSTHAAVGW